MCQALCLSALHMVTHLILVRLICLLAAACNCISFVPSSASCSPSRSLSRPLVLVATAAPAIFGRCRHIGGSSLHGHSPLLWPLPITVFFTFAVDAAAAYHVLTAGCGIASSSFVSDMGDKEVAASDPGGQPNVKGMEEEGAGAVVMAGGIV